MQKICLFGGTFNPVHLGHINLAYKIYDSFLLDKLIIIPSYIPPHKKDNIIDGRHRFEMLKLVFQNSERNIEISDFEIKSSGISYTYKTLKHFRQIYQNDILYFLTGSDIFSIISSWKKWEELFNYTNFIVLNRKEKNYNDMIKELPKEVNERFAEKINKKFGQIQYFETDEYDISSTKIRNDLKNGKKNDFLPDIIYTYIIKNNLYRGIDG